MRTCDTAELWLKGLNAYRLDQIELGVAMGVYSDELGRDELGQTEVPADPDVALFFSRVVDGPGDPVPA